MHVQNRNECHRMETRQLNRRNGLVRTYRFATGIETDANSVRFRLGAESGSQRIRRQIANSHSRIMTWNHMVMQRKSAIRVLGNREKT
jgi:hypothetical protein